MQVHLIDDDPAVRKAIALLLITVGIDTRTYATPDSFLSQVSQSKPGPILLDLRMPVMSGLKLQERLRELGVAWPTIMITGHGDVEACRRAFRNGALDFLTKPVDETDLLEAIQRAMQVMEADLRYRAEVSETLWLLDTLTPRELQVLQQIAGGFTTKEIAAALDLSPRTVESHRVRIAEKLGTTSVAELTRLWMMSTPAAP